MPSTYRIPFNQKVIKSFARSIPLACLPNTSVGHEGILKVMLQCLGEEWQRCRAGDGVGDGCQTTA